MLPLFFLLPLFSHPPHSSLHRVLAVPCGSAFSSCETSSNSSRLASWLCRRVQDHCVLIGSPCGFFLLHNVIALVASPREALLRFRRHRARRVSPRGFFAVAKAISVFSFRRADSTPCSASTLSSRLNARLSWRDQLYRTRRVSLRRFISVANGIALVACLRAALAPFPTSLRLSCLAARVPLCLQSRSDRCISPCGFRAVSNILVLVPCTCLSLLGVHEISSMMHLPCHDRVGISLVHGARTSHFCGARSEGSCTLPLDLLCINIIALPQIFCHIFNLSRAVLLVRISARSVYACAFIIF